MKWRIKDYLASRTVQKRHLAIHGYSGGYNLNLTLSSAKTSPQLLLALVDTFFGAGGQELQINVLDSAILRVAQHDNESHRHIVIRMAGLSARFVEISPVEQNEIIRRAEMAERRL